MVAVAIYTSNPDRWQARRASRNGDLMSGMEDRIQNTQNARLTEFVAAVLLALTSTVTSWSAYQADLWSGRQATNYSRANALRLDSTREFTAAGQLEQIDVALFTSWVNAYASNNQQLANFYRDRFRPEFRKSFDSWIALRPLLTPNAPKTPFALPDYRVTKQLQAEDLQREADKVFLQGQNANQFSDGYVMATAVLAVVMFFAGITQQFTVIRVRLILLSLAGIMFLFGLITALRLPRA